MGLSSLTFGIAFAVSVVNSVQLKEYPNGCNDLSRYEEQPDQKWTWGPANINEDTKFQLFQPNKEAPRTPRPPLKPVTNKAGPNDNPCFKPRPVKPDFSASGRRISVTKCYEYIWQIKYREMLAKDEKECKEYTKLHPESGIIGTAAIGGRDAKPGEFPHMGALGWKAREGTWVFKCGGTLISEKFVLTAAHCTKATDRDTVIADVVPKIVRFGDKNIIDVFANGINPTDADIKRIIVHPQYKSPKKYNDIALMELESELDFNNNVQPACLWNSFDVSALGKQAGVTGWGIFESGGRDTSPVLQIAVVDFIDSATCDRLLRPQCNRHWCGIQDTQICAGKLAGGVDACQGDSGGPLSVRIPLPVSAEGAMHHVVGVTSFGFGCALKDTPGVYTRVSSFVPWIESIVWPTAS